MQALARKLRRRLADETIRSIYGAAAVGERLDEKQDKQKPAALEKRPAQRRRF
jgi:hypothetical protein